MNRYTLAKKSHSFKNFLRVSNPAYSKEVKSYFYNALINDIEPNGDITSTALLTSNLRAKADVICKMGGVLAGVEELVWILKNNPIKSFQKVNMKIFKSDGDKIKKGDLLMQISGRAADLLILERTILNFLQRMCGVATYANAVVKNLPKNVLVCSTRKTFWGALDKKACIVGGAGSHRINLSDAILIKDNHINLAGNFENVIQKLKTSKNLGRFIEIEVVSLKMALSLANYLIEKGIPKYKKIPVVIMFDNMSPSKIKKVLSQFKKDGLYSKFLFEASGGITPKNIKDYSKTGVDIISMGALTHSAPALDISMKMGNPTQARS